MISSKLSIEIDSRRCNRSYEVHRFTEFDISIDLETDSDTFDIVAENPNGIYTGLFCRFDHCRLKVNGKNIMTGNIDSVTYYISSSTNYIKFTGRDLCWLLVDNDAIPDTIEGVQPKKYIEKTCNSYGIKCKVSQANVYDKLIIGCEESEISVMNNILLNSKQRIWYLVDTLYTGAWTTDASISHTFVMGGSSYKDCIPIKSVQLKEDGTDMVSTVLVYGSDSEGNEKIMGEYSNDYMMKKGIKKRTVKRFYSDSAVSSYISVAKSTVRDNFRDDTELIITVPIKDVYMPNTTGRVIISDLGIDTVMFIKSVQYSKSISDGGKAMITMIPADSAFEKLWSSSTAISITNFTELSKKLANHQISGTTLVSSAKSGEYFPACEYSGESIVDALKSIGVSSSYSYREKIATANGITNYGGSTSQNIQMLNLLKSGKLIKP